MAARRVTQMYESVLAPSRLTVTQLSILGEIESRGARPPAMAELAEVLAMDRSSMGHTLRPLERDDLVRLVPDDGDRRTKRVELTAAGKKKFLEAQPLWAAAQARFEETFGNRNAAELRHVLATVASVNF